MHSVSSSTRLLTLSDNSRPASWKASIGVSVVVLYLQLLLGGVTVAGTSVDFARWSLRQNPLSLDLLLVALPLLSGLFLFAYRDSKKVGLAGDLPSRSANAVMISIMLLLVLGGVTQLSSEAKKGDADRFAAILQFGDAFPKCRAAANPQTGFEHLGQVREVLSTSILAPFVRMPYEVWRSLVTAETLIFLVVLIGSTFILAEIYQTLNESDLGKEVSLAEQERRYLDLERRINLRLIESEFRPWVAKWSLNGKLPSVILSYALRIVCFTLVIVVLTVVVQARGGTVNPYSLSLAWLVCLTFISFEIVWLSSDTRVFSGMVFGSLFLATSVYTGLLFDAGYVVSSISTVVVMTGEWVVRTLSPWVARNAPSDTEIHRFRRISTREYGGVQFIDEVAFMEMVEACIDSNPTKRGIGNLTGKWIENTAAEGLFRRQLGRDLVQRNQLCNFLVDTRAEAQGVLSSSGKSKTFLAP